MCTGSKDTEKSVFLSSGLYSDLTVGLALKNYPKMTPDTNPSIGSEKKLSFSMSADVYIDLMVDWP